VAYIKKHTPPAQVQVIRNRFESWRKAKLGRERIPEPLWASAVKLCERYSAHRVSRWLRLNSAALRQRLNGSQASSKSAQGGYGGASPFSTAGGSAIEGNAKGNHPPSRLDDKAPAFVEWVATSQSPMPPSAAEYVFELEGARGSSLRICARGARVPEVAQLASLLRREIE
jgi:hypothetical protein